MSFLSGKSAGPSSGRPLESLQCAALCFRKSGNAVEILLITSRDTGRWVIPKGWPIKGMSAAESAQREAFEEAGARGPIIGDEIGEFGYLKRLGGDKTLHCRVKVFPLRVTEMARDFPEKGQRELKWFKPEAAALKVQEPELRAILERFHAPD